MLRTVTATRYVTPLREGGSLPAIVEADDDGLYVVKFSGAGQGTLALAAELIGGEIGRALGIPVPEIVFIQTDAALGRNEPDPEIRALLLASTGLNLGIDYLPGSMMFDPAVDKDIDTGLASRAVWFDAFITNVDRTPRNPNLLIWHKSLYFIDHGASLYFHHDWRDIERKALTPFAAIRDHVLLRWADDIACADQYTRARSPLRTFDEIVSWIPDAWTTDERRAGYREFLSARLAHSQLFVEEAIRARESRR